MDNFTYRDGQLFAEDVALADLADDVGTPFFCYSSATMVRHYRVLADAFHGLDTRIFYAVKANSNLAVIRTLSREGAGADVVSEGEIRRALAAGVAPDAIVFSGVGKTQSEMAMAIEAGVLLFNVESEPELNALSEVAASRNATVDMAIRINPDVDAGTPDKISTGRKGDKFGIAWPEARSVYVDAAKMPGINVAGVACHIGSQILDLTPYKSAFEIAAGAVSALREDGHTITRLDLGGGLGVPYDNEVPPSPADYGKMVRNICGDLGVTIMLEPGRVLVANAGVFVMRVIYVKETPGGTFYVVDGAMNDLVRPTLYDAHHTIIPVTEPLESAPLKAVDVVGPVCESGDILAQNRDMPPVVAGDLLAMRTAGAYGAVMSSTYNSRLLVPEVLVKDGNHAIVRARPSYDDLWRDEHMPDWCGD